LVKKRSTAMPPSFVSFFFTGLLFERGRMLLDGISMDVMACSPSSKQKRPYAGRFGCLNECSLTSEPACAGGPGLRDRRLDFDGDLILANLQ
jgi:hypothetical protein